MQQQIILEKQKEQLQNPSEILNQQLSKLEQTRYEYRQGLTNKYCALGALVSGSIDMGYIPKTQNNGEIDYFHSAVDIFYKYEEYKNPSNGDVIKERENKLKAYTTASKVQSLNDEYHKTFSEIVEWLRTNQ